jgi:uncharacterized damage-inducible protein DinB
MTRPQENEAAVYYSRYISLVQSEDILPALKSQLEETKLFLANISDEKSLQSYAPGKWTIRQVMNHVNDTERVFMHRALWFARGFKDALPSFEQNTSVAAATANQMSWTGLKDEFAHVRLDTISFFENLPPEAWSRTGIASDNPFTVNALAYIIAGHVTHHRNVIAERYL